MQNVEEKSPSIDDIKSKLLVRVFINNCDTYIGHNIAEVIKNTLIAYGNTQNTLYLNYLQGITY